MTTTTLHSFTSEATNRKTSKPNLSFTYAAAHLTALSAVGILYLLGIFDAGFPGQESFGVQLITTLFAKIF